MNINRYFVIYGGDSELLMQTRTKKCIQRLTIHRFQTPHCQLMWNNVVR